MATTADFLTKIDETIKDPRDRLTTAAKTNFLKEAIRQYSRDKPRTTDAKLAGDGTLQDFPVPTTWVTDFSVLLEAEFPIDLIPPAILDLQDNLLLVRRDGAERILTLLLTLGATESMRLVYTTQHLVDGTTVPDNDFDAVANLTSARAARAIAIELAESTEDTINVDVVDHQGKARDFDDLEHITEGETAVAELLHFDTDIAFSWRRDFLTHPRRFR